VKRIVFAAGLVVLVFGIAILAQTKTESVEQELIRLENEWNNAWVNRNIAIFDRIEADDYFMTSDGGNIITKAQDIAAVESGEDVATSVVSDEFKVRVYGDAAVVTYRMAVTGQYKGKDNSDQFRWTDTWIKEDGRWQVVAAHQSRIVQK
jgi:ketosteroid isomerase-like protein